EMIGIGRCGQEGSREQQPRLGVLRGKYSGLCECSSCRPRISGVQRPLPVSDEVLLRTRRCRRLGRQLVLVALGLSGDLRVRERIGLSITLLCRKPKNEGKEYEAQEFGHGTSLASRSVQAKLSGTRGLTLHSLKLP